MKPLKLLIMLTLAMTFSLSIVSETKAEISNAAVLFLRIAPGARPSAMGESYVAIADDATATHWNPAGLGSFPLADSWSSEDARRWWEQHRGFDVALHRRDTITRHEAL